jgi:hypothetical protein
MNDILRHLKQLKCDMKILTLIGEKVKGPNNIAVAYFQQEGGKFYILAEVKENKTFFPYLLSWTLMKPDPGLGYLLNHYSIELK